MADRMDLKEFLFYSDACCDDIWLALFYCVAELLLHKIFLTFGLVLQLQCFQSLSAPQIFLHSILQNNPIHQSLQNLDSLKSKALCKREIWVQFPFWVKFGVFILSLSFSLSRVVFDHNFNFKEYLYIPWNSLTTHFVHKFQSFWPSVVSISG